MIRYLAGNEKPDSRGLWEEAFPEDSKAFDDYYFKEKLKDNRILVLENEGIDAMIQLNPYLIQARGRRWRVDYLVGVATRKERRHRGYMRQLLLRMMADMRQEQMPFCFLMPADEAIYRPFGFTWIFDQPQVGLREDVTLTRRDLLPWSDSLGSSHWLAELADWINGWLAQAYEVYALRDAAYLRRLLKEIDSEDGCFQILYDGDVMAGVYSEWGLAEREQRLLYAKPLYVRERGAAKPAIMARIISPEEFVRVIRLREGAPVGELEVILRISDPLIAENDGVWRWRLTHETSWLERCGEDKETDAARKTAAGQEFAAGTPGKPAAVPELRLTITELTGWLFGYDRPAAAGGWADMVETLDGVFLDEVV